MVDKIELFPTLIKFIDSPSKELQMKAIKKDPLVIDLIDSPSEEVQMYILKNHQDNCDMIRNPCMEIQKFLLENKANVGCFHEMIIDEDVCKGCEELCVYKNFDGLYDGCPRFLEHFSLK